MDPTVEYRMIPGYPAYRAGSDGSIWSANNPKYKTKDAHFRKLKCTVRPDGYIATSLPRMGRFQSQLVHRLILLTFVGECPDGMEACHRDGVRSNNAVTNLRYDTRKANVHDKFKHGTMKKGTEIAQAKITEKDVLAIRSLAEDGVYHHIVARAFGLSTRQIHRIVTRQRWSWIK